MTDDDAEQDAWIKMMISAEKKRNWDQSVALWTLGGIVFAMMFGVAMLVKVMP